MQPHVALAAGLALFAFVPPAPARLHAQPADSPQHDRPKMHGSAGEHGPDQAPVPARPPVVFGGRLVMHLGPQVSVQQPPVEILAPTFSQHVAPIVYAKCIRCHRPGEVAPMSLINYRDVAPWTAPIRRQLLERTMPPFHSHSRYGLLVDTPRLTPHEISTILRWVDNGAPEGDPALLPELPILASRQGGVPRRTP